MLISSREDYFLCRSLRSPWTYGPATSVVVSNRTVTFLALLTRIIEFLQTGKYLRSRVPARKESIPDWSRKRPPWLGARAHPLLLDTIRKVTRENVVDGHVSSLAVDH